MRVHVHTGFCFLCMVTFLSHHCSHCRRDGLTHDHRHAHSDLQVSQAPYLQAGRPSETPPTGPDEAAMEQHFYIQQLFRRYGQSDRLDFGGFQSLLLSLGLGQVKVVGLEHDDLGHDHVAHLDILEVQEKHHSHSPSHPRHHQHPHSQAHTHPHTEQETNQTTVRHSPCSLVTTATKNTFTIPTTDGEPPKQHNHSERDGKELRPHGHDEHHQKISHIPQNSDITGNHGDDQAQPRRAEQRSPGITVQPTQELPPPETRTKRPRKPSRSKVLHNKTRGSTAPPLSPSAGSHRTNGRLSPTEDQGGTALPPIDHQEHDHSNEERHLHIRKREAIDSLKKPAETTLIGHSEGKEHQHEECLNLTQLLHYYGLKPDSLISPAQFNYLCPALLYQIDSRVCIRHYHQVDVKPSAAESTKSAWIWVWGFTSITIISLLSLLGVILVPIINQSCFKFLLTFLVALAVGTLSGDALLHLLPHSQGEHNHTHSNNSEVEEVDLWIKFDGVWKGLTALAGIYLLFIVEHCIGMVKHHRDQGGSWCGQRGKREEAKAERPLSDPKLSRHSEAELLRLKPLATDGPEMSVLSCDNRHNDNQLLEMQELSRPLAVSDPGHGDHGVHSAAKKAAVRKHGHGHSHSHCHSDQEMKDAGIASIAWMVIMGDGMHNFSDGLAIGAAFSDNVTGGISTSVAVFCHELPHELGDFAVLLKAGMSVKQAIVYNLLSALMAYVGMLIGTAVGQHTHDLTSWIFAITAGMFLYVALVDMLPEMLHGDSEEHKRYRLGHFLLQNLGMLTGFAIMLLIAIFEDRIVLDFGF